MSGQANCKINPHGTEHNFRYAFCTWCAEPEESTVHNAMRAIINAAVDPVEAEALHKLLWDSFSMMPQPRATRFAGVSRFVRTFLENEVRRMDGLDAGPDDDEEKIKILLGTLNQLVLQGNPTED